MRVTIDKLVIRMRGVSRGEAHRAAATLGPALQRALAAGKAPIVSRSNVETKAAPRGTAPLADRIAAPLARALRGGKR